MSSQTSRARSNKRFEIPETPQGRDGHEQKDQKKQTSTPAAAPAAPEAAKPGTGTETSFHHDAPGAKNVLLAGEFTQWDKQPIKMIKGGGGVWHTKVALPPGRHHYRFLVDGEWHNDAVRHERVPNSFGSFNNVVEVK